MKKWVILINLGFCVCSQIGYAIGSTGLDLVELKGDLRYRYEIIDKESDKTRTRNRIRTRLGIKAKVNDNVSLNFQLASGSDDPVSANQTLTESFSSKSIQIDLAHFDWKASNKIKILGGKMKLPFYKPGKTELIWDGDLNPEGLAAKYQYSFKVIDLFANTGYFWIEERKKDDDSILIGGQAGLQMRAFKDKYLLLGVGYYNYQNIRGFKPFSDPEDSFDNSVDDSGNYALDYADQEIFVELGGKILGKPAAIFGNHVVNTASEVGNDWGYLLGVTLGKCKAPLSYALRYNYRHLEKDAVIGAFTDSDFGGGGTDAKGHEAGIDFQVAKHVKTGVSYFVNKKGVDNSKDYKRLQVDVAFKF